MVPNWKNVNSIDETYYSGYPTSYQYRDTGESSFADFEEILELCFENKIKLDIVFGPSNIRQWESLNFNIGFSYWMQWKKDVVLAVNKIAKQYSMKKFNVFDFSVYHNLTSQILPVNNSMKYYWDSSHYKNELGLIVLDKLNGGTMFNNFGVSLNVNNIDKHIRTQQKNRKKYINVKEYQLRVFKSLKDLK